jgi:hypothetical protein
MYGSGTSPVGPSLKGVILAGTSSKKCLSHGTLGIRALWECSMDMRMWHERHIIVWLYLGQ